MTRRTKAQLEAELAELKAQSKYGPEWHRIASEVAAEPRQKPIGIVVLLIVSDIAVILVALFFLFRMWLG